MTGIAEPADTRRAPAHPTRWEVAVSVLRGGLRQARIALRIEAFSWNVLSWVMFPAIGLVVMFFLRDSELMSSQVSLAAYGVPGLITMTLMSTGVLAVAGQLLTEREDGSLLRAKAVPNGMASHLLANTLFNLGITLAPALVLLLGAVQMFNGIGPQGAAGWLRVGVFAVLGLLATLPLGAVIGAVVPSPAMFGWVSLLLYGALVISGIFYPLTALPGWLQIVGQALPMYWMGLGLRSGFLPDAAAAIEVGESWRVAQSVTALGIWAAVGVTLAPVLLRRMVRRQSGSQVAAARERVLAKGY